MAAYRFGHGTAHLLVDAVIQ